MAHVSTRRIRRRLNIAFMAAARRQLWEFASTVAVVVLLLAVSLGSQSVQAAKNAQHVVIIKQMHFDPVQLTIHSGETVEWKNEDIFSHTVTADDGSFDSGLIAPGGSWQMTVKITGKIGYHCRPHPNMTAALIVQAAAGQQATPSHARCPAATKVLIRSKWSPPTAPEQFHPILSISRPHYCRWLY